MLWLQTLLLLFGAEAQADKAISPLANDPITPPTAITGSGMANMNYPEEAVRLRQEGLSVAQVHVNAKGKVKTCSIRQSSGSPSLDKATCTLARSQRFKPARDSQGKAVEGDAPVRMNWHLPAR